ncbi:MAG: S-layer homology domain-containing protein [Clostridiales bacterium]|nr:S-layer homology domain-containing protein [Clostridiales bacterium]
MREKKAVLSTGQGKKLGLLTLVCVLLLTAHTPAALAAEAPSPWAEEQVYAAIEAKLVPVRLQEDFTRAVTRAEFCALIVRMYESATGAPVSGRTGFADTSDVNVEKAAALGIVAGTGGGLFSPDATMTREQAAVMLVRLADVVGLPFPYKPADYADIDEISPWALESVGRAKAAGVMSGTGSFLFSPKTEYSVEQGIVTLYKLHNFLIAYNDEKERGYDGATTEIADQSTPLGAFPADEKSGVMRQYAEKVMELVNRERAREDLAPLVEVKALNQAAAIRAVELEKGISHQRPDGRLGPTVFKDLDIANKIRAENIAGNYRTPESVVEAWMNSPSHRAIIMDPRYTGQGVVVRLNSSGEMNWAHLFMG